MVEIPVAVPPQPSAPAPRARNGRLLSMGALAAVLALSACGLWLSIPAPQTVPETGAQAMTEATTASMTDATTGAAVQDEAAAVPVEEAAPSETASADAPPFDYEAVNALRSAMLDTATPPSAHFAATPDAAAPPADAPAGEASGAPPVADAAPAVPSVRAVPLPVARPPQFRGAVTSDQPRGARQPRRARVAAAAPAAPMEDTRSFFEKFFGIQPSQPAARTPALAYAALEAPATKPALPPRVLLSPAPVPLSVPGGVAVYDISARSVTLPSGERLEAHSGLGEIMDDPRYVNVPMRGATPPGTYDLTEREAPFHGVRAIRMTPVGGSEAIYGRAGILAHTYMLRAQPGASNGCVVFRNYERFLQAYLNGEVRRLVVVPGSGGAPPAIANGATGRSARLGSDG